MKLRPPVKPIARQALPFGYPPVHADCPEAMPRSPEATVTANTGGLHNPAPTVPTREPSRPDRPASRDVCGQRIAALPVRPVINRERAQQACP